MAFQIDISTQIVDASLDLWSGLGSLVGAIAPIATVLGVILSALFALWRLNQQAKASRGRFLLELMRDFRVHNVVETNLRPAGRWSAALRKAPKTSKEWASLEDYMSFFEQCESLLKEGLLSKSVFKNLFSGPLQNLITHPHIMAEKLRGEERAHWELFISLARRFNYSDCICPEKLREAVNSEFNVPQDADAELDEDNIDIEQFDYDTEMNLAVLENSGNIFSDSIALSPAIITRSMEIIVEAEKQGILSDNTLSTDERNKAILDIANKLKHRDELRISLSRKADLIASRQGKSSRDEI